MKTEFCSYCSKHKDDVVMIVSPNEDSYIGICNECITLCIQILNERLHKHIFGENIKLKNISL